MLIYLVDRKLFKTFSFSFSETGKVWLNSAVKIFSLTCPLHNEV